MEWLKWYIAVIVIDRANDIPFNKYLNNDLIQFHCWIKYWRKKRKNVPENNVPIKNSFPASFLQSLGSIFRANSLINANVVAQFRYQLLLHLIDVEDLFVVDQRKISSHSADVSFLKTKGEREDKILKFFSDRWNNNFFLYNCFFFKLSSSIHTSINFYSFVPTYFTNFVFDPLFFLRYHFHESSLSNRANALCRFQIQTVKHVDELLSSIQATILVSIVQKPLNNYPLN